MPYRYVHVGIGYIAPPYDPAALEPIAAQISKDWLRYATNAWVLWTDKSLITVTEMFQTRLTPNDQILALTIDRSEIPAGLLPQWAWEWINRARDSNTGNVVLPPPVYPTGNIDLAEWGIDPESYLSTLSGISKLLTGGKLTE